MEQKLYHYSEFIDKRLSRWKCLFLIKLWIIVILIFYILYTYPSVWKMVFVLVCGFECMRWYESKYNSFKWNEKKLWKLVKVNRKKISMLLTFTAGILLRLRIKENLAYLNCLREKLKLIRAYHCRHFFLICIDIDTGFHPLGAFV